MPGSIGICWIGMEENRLDAPTAEQVLGGLTTCWSCCRTGPKQAHERIIG